MAFSLVWIFLLTPTFSILLKPDFHCNGVHFCVQRNIILKPFMGKVLIKKYFSNRWKWNSFCIAFDNRSFCAASVVWPIPCQSAFELQRLFQCKYFSSIIIMDLIPVENSSFIYWMTAWIVRIPFGPPFLIPHTSSIMIISEIPTIYFIYWNELKTTTKLLIEFQYLFDELNV